MHNQTTGIADAQFIRASYIVVSLKAQLGGSHKSKGGGPSDARLLVGIQKPQLEEWDDPNLEIERVHFEGGKDAPQARYLEEADRGEDSCYWLT